jgi:sulfur-oxidizing protein SoxA
VIWRLSFVKDIAKGLAALALYGLALSHFAQTYAQTHAQSDQRKSGTNFLSKQLQDLQGDADKHPAQLWIQRGYELWSTSCKSCHGEIGSLKQKVASFPKLNKNKQLVNLEDYLASHAQPSLAEGDVLALSSALHQAAKGESINAMPIEPFYSRGQTLWNTRMGRINLACMHCHDIAEGRVGANMKAEVISQAQPTGFPIYRLSWQTLGTIERRLRACYSGVQAPIPAAGSPELRDLELFLKVRANGMTIDGPSIRR